MRRPPSTACAALALLSACFPAPPASPAPGYCIPAGTLLRELRPAERVRVHRVGGSYLEGTVARTGLDTLVLDRNGAEWLVPRTSIDSLWRARRPAAKGAALRGAGAGLIVTAVFYGLMKLAEHDSPSSDDAGVSGRLLPFMAGVFGGLGAAVGGALGESDGPWHRIHPALPRP